MKTYTRAGLLAAVLLLTTLIAAGCAGADIVEVAGHKIAVPSGSTAMDPGNWDAKYSAPLDPEKVLEFYSQGKAMKNLGWDLGSYSAEEQRLSLTLLSEADVYFYQGDLRVHIQVAEGQLDGQSVLRIDVTGG